tara:strand:+ start:697 stop:1695 length:999 start_codon:yes stop_codon:yes gene_type:complete
MNDLVGVIEKELREVFQSRSIPLYRMMSYHLRLEDARGNITTTVDRIWSHGLACLMVCRELGGNIETLLPAAASLELTNGFNEIHEDIENGTPSRDGQDAVWWVWGPAQAINAGDGMHALARLVMLKIQERGSSADIAYKSIQVLDECSLSMSVGRFLDLEAQERIDIDVNSYLEMADGKTGSLYACAMKLGALIGKPDSPHVESLGLCGTNLGVAIQISDDIRAIWGNDESDFDMNPEVLNKKKLLPVAYAIEVGDLKIKRRLGDIYFKRVLEQDDATAVREILDETGAKTFCENIVNQKIEEANKAIESFEREYGESNLVSDLLRYRNTK